MATLATWSGAAPAAISDPEPAEAALFVPGPTLPLIAAAILAATHAPRLVQNERMEFAIDYKGVRVGKSELFLGRSDGGVIPAFLQTRTTGVAAIITIRQQLSSNIDRTTGLPRSNSLEAVEGNYRHSDTASFDRTTNKATVRRRGKHDNTYVVDVPPGSVDFLAMVYLLRAMPLEVGTMQAFHVLAAQTVSRIETEVVARERVSTGIGDLPALKVRVPTGFDGKFEEKNPTFIWFSDDHRRVIVQISTDFAIGRATARLLSYSPGDGAEHGVAR
jgi:hypothetical protein